MRFFIWMNLLIAEGDCETEVPRGLKPAPPRRSFAGGRAGFAEKPVNTP
jgi:hypothetical protein